MSPPAWLGRGGRGPAKPSPVIPADPARVLTGPLDPALIALRASVASHRQRLWLRRLVRRGWMALAAVVPGRTRALDARAGRPHCPRPSRSLARPSRCLGLLGWLDRWE